MADLTPLTDLDPYDLHDVECARIAARFEMLDVDGWAAPSGCAGWSRRDLLGHLVAVEEYFGACLDGSVAPLMQRYTDQGVTSVDEFGEAGVVATAAQSTHDLVSVWLVANSTNRAGFRAADGTDIDTSVGAYPGRQQAFHVAFEYAIHSNDLESPVAADEVDDRQAWLARVARFALTEVKDDVSVADVDGQIVVTQGETSATFDRDTFVAGVSGRAEPGVLTAAEAELLSLGY